MFKAYADFWKKYVNFKDRSTVADYWWAVLCNTIVMAVIVVILITGAVTGAVQISNSYDTMGYDSRPIFSMFLILIIGIVLLILWRLATLIPNISIMVRRLRDAGLSPWLGLLLAVRYITPIISMGATMTALSNLASTGGYGYNSMDSLRILSGMNGTALNMVLTLINFGITIFFFVVSVLPTKEVTEVSKNTSKTTVIEKTSEKVAPEKTVATKKVTPKKTTAKKVTTKKEISKTAPKKTTVKETSTTKADEK